LAERSEFLGFFKFFVGAALMCVFRAPFADAEDLANVHNMLVFGERSIFLSHMPMFDGLSHTGDDYTSPHRYQVILEAALTDEQSSKYQGDRKLHPAVRFYTLNPERLVLTRLFTPKTGPQMSFFTATIFRGHLEREGSAKVPGLETVRINIARVVHAHKFDPAQAKQDALEYLIVGKGSERFLAHTIVAPPDFDQILSIAAINPNLADDDLRQDIRITVPDRKNASSLRLREGDRVQALLTVGSKAPASVQLLVGAEIYFEEGELLVPPTFEPTPQEAKE
jgi:hypothetical protein